MDNTLKSFVYHLLEGKLEALTKFPFLEDEIDELAAMGFDGDEIEWAARQLNTGETMVDIVEVLETFVSERSMLPPAERNIRRYKTLSDLKRIVFGRGEGNAVARAQQGDESIDVRNQLVNSVANQRTGSIFNDRYTNVIAPNLGGGGHMGAAGTFPPGFFDQYGVYFIIDKGHPIERNRQRYMSMFVKKEGEQVRLFDQSDALLWTGDFSDLASAADETGYDKHSWRFIIHAINNHRT